MSEENKALLARVTLEAINRGKLEVIDEVVSSDFVQHGDVPAGMPSGREGLKASVAAMRQAFPDLNNTINLEIAEGDLVVQYVTITGTQQGEFAGMAPSGKQATWDVIHIGRVRAGKIVEHWAVADRLGMLQQLGLTQVPEQMRSTG